MYILALSRWKIVNTTEWRHWTGKFLHALLIWRGQQHHYIAPEPSFLHGRVSYFHSRPFRRARYLAKSCTRGYHHLRQEAPFSEEPDLVGHRHVKYFHPNRLYCRSNFLTNEQFTSLVVLYENSGLTFRIFDPKFSPFLAEPIR